VKLTRPPRTRLQRALARAPIWLYRNVLEDPRVRVGSDRDHGIPLVALSPR
jgi:hypothetical protein